MPIMDVKGPAKHEARDQAGGETRPDAPFRVASDGHAASPGDGRGQRRPSDQRRPMPPRVAFLVLVTVVLAVLAALRSWLVPPAASEYPSGAPPPATVVLTPQPQATTALSTSPVPTAGTVIQEVLPVGDPLEVEVTAAYREYWRVYGEALYTLDASEVPAVATGQELQRITQRVEALKAQGEAVRVNVDHVTRVARVSGTEADLAVRDLFTDRSYAINPVTKQPVEAVNGSSNSDVELAKGVEEDVLYLLKRVEGSWKVVRSFRVTS